MTHVVIIGAGGHAQVVADILIQQRHAGENMTILGYLDDNLALHGQTRLGLPILGGSSRLLDPSFQADAVIVAIGNNRVRQKIVQQLDQQNVTYASAIHPRAVIGTDVSIEPGCMICANVVLNAGTQIGRHTIINTAATVDHHNQIGDFVHCAPGSHTGGEVQLQNGVFLGIGATVLPRTTVEEWATVGGGAVVHRHIPAKQTVVGVPARPIYPAEGAIK